MGLNFRTPQRFESILLDIIIMILIYIKGREKEKFNIDLYNKCGSLLNLFPPKEVL